MIKVVFRNMIGKTLYEGNISGKMSKIRKVEEKTQKNQAKILMVRMN
jgi:hypothetical protein